MIAHWGFPNYSGDPTSNAICMTTSETSALVIGLDIIFPKLSNSEILAYGFLLSTAGCIAIPGAYAPSMEMNRVVSP